MPHANQVWQSGFAREDTLHPLGFLLAKNIYRSAPEVFTAWFEVSVRRVWADIWPHFLLSLHICVPNSTSNGFLFSILQNSHHIISVQLICQWRKIYQHVVICPNHAFLVLSFFLERWRSAESHVLISVNHYGTRNHLFTNFLIELHSYHIRI